MDISKKFATDAELELNGVWQEIGRDTDGKVCRVKIARTGNERYAKLMDRLMRPHRRAVRTGQMDDGLWDSIIIRVIAETVLLDWENIDDNGVAVPYSKENAIALMTKYKDFRILIAEIANEMETFRNVEVGEAEKN